MNSNQLGIIRIALLITMLLAAFGQPTNVQAAARSSEKNNPDFETRVYTRKQCVISEDDIVTVTDEDPRIKPKFIGTLAGIFVPILIGKALGGVSAAIKKAGDPETLRDTGRFPTYLYDLKSIPENGGGRRLTLRPDLMCIIVVRGQFSGPDPEDQSKVSFPSKGSIRGSGQATERMERLRASNIPVTKIAMLYEAKVKPSNDRTAFLYESKFLEVDSFQGGRSQNKRNLVIGITIYGIGPKEGDQTLSLALLNMGEVTKGVLPENRLNRVNSSWIGGIGVSKSFLETAASLDMGKQTTMAVFPVTIEGTFAETDEGNKALRFIAEVLGAASEDLTESISGAITKDREQEAEEEANALEQMIADEESSYGKMLEAQEKFLADSNSEAKRFEVRRTCRIWKNKAATLKLAGHAPNSAPTFCT